MILVFKIFELFLITNKQQSTGALGAQVIIHIIKLWTFLFIIVTPIHHFWEITPICSDYLWVL